MSIQKMIALALIAIYILLIRASYITGVQREGRKIFVTALYILGIFYIVGQGVYYANALPDSSPDEVAHISYIYHIRQTHELIPHFEDMHLFTSEPLKWSEDYYQYNDGLINYLCHPSLYYHIMRMAGGFTEIEPSVVQIDKMRLRYFSLIISTLGVLMVLYIGWSRIDKTKPWLHLLYVTASTSVPIMCLEMCGVTNDSLAILTSSICALGLIRFCEDNRNFATYLMISGGITLSFLNKMTAAMLCVVMSLIVLVCTIIKEKDIKRSLKKEFWFTTPLFILPIIYIAVIYHRYGVLQPTLKVISPVAYFEESFFFTPVEERVVATPMAYVSNYLNNFFISWSGLVTDDLSLRKTSPFAVSTLPLELLWIAPVFVFHRQFKNVANKLTLPIAAGWFSVLITFLLQLKKAYGNYITNGYTGGSQARYYLPLIFCMALSIAFIFDGLLSENGFDRNTETTTITDVKSFTRKAIYNQLIYGIGLAYGLLLFYSNFPFFLLHN